MDERTSSIPDAIELAFAVPPPEGMTEQQIEARHALVGLHREITGQRHYDTFPFVRYLSAIPHAEAVAIIENEEAAARSHKYVGPNLNEYREYVSDLKDIRQGQMSYVEKVMDGLPESTPPDAKRAAYLDALEHSPPLASRTLQRLNQVATTDRRIDRKLFSEDQIAEAAGDKALFQQTLVQVMLKEPAIVLGASKVLSKVAEPEQVRTALNALRETDPAQLNDHLEFITQMYPPEDAKTVIMEIAEKDPAYMLLKVMKPEIGAIIGDDGQRRIAQKAIHEGKFLPSDHPLELCVKRGFLTRKEIKQRLSSLVEDQPAWVPGSVLANENLISKADREAITQKVRDTYAAADLDAFGSIDGCAALTFEDKQALVRARFEAAPQDCLRNIPGLVDSYAEPQHVRQAFLDQMASGASDVYKEPVLIFTSRALTAGDKRDYTLELVAKNPTGLLQCLKFMDGIYGNRESVFDRAELTAIVQRATKDLDLHSLYNASSYIEYVGNAEEQKQFLIKQFDRMLAIEVPKDLQNGEDVEAAIAKGNIFSLFSASNKDMLEQLFSPEERLGLLHRAVASKLNDKLLSAADMQTIREFFPEAEYRNIAEQIRTTDTETFVSVMYEVAFLYSPEQLSEAVNLMAEDPAKRHQLLEVLEYNTTGWTHFADEATIWRVISRAEPRDYQLLISVGEKLEQELSADRMRQLAENIAANNPALALTFEDFFAKHIPSFDHEIFVQTALRDERYMSIMGNYLKATLPKVLTARPTTRDLLLIDAMDAYASAEKLLRSGTIGGLKVLRDKFQPKSKAERRLLDTYDVLASLGSPEDIAACQQAESLEAVDTLLAQVTARYIGIREPVNAENADRLRRTMERIAPLGLYITQYGDRSPFNAVLQPLTESLLRGEYETWKFGPDTEQNLQSMKALGLLPVHLSLEQYRAWRIETETVQHEVFTVETQAVVSEVKRILSDNAAQLPPGSIIPQSEKAEALQTITEDLAGIGQEIASLHQELKALKSQASPELAASQIDSVKSMLTDYMQARRDMQIQQDVIQLTHLTDAEVSSGTLLPIAGSDKGRPIVQALQRLRKDMRSDNGFILQQLNQVFESYSQQTGAAQTLRVSDTASPRTTFEIGETPVASCQNYRSGVVNEGLLGYTDPNSKILFTRNERDNAVARSVFRLLSDPQGNPALHVETIYSADLSDGVSRAIYHHAINKAQAMGVPVFVSEISQNAQGEEVGIRKISGIRYAESSLTLSSDNSRAPFVYVDASGGIKDKGRYTIENMARITLG